MRVDNDDDALAAIAKLERKVDELTAQVMAIRRQFFWQRIWSVARTLLIVVPLIWAAVSVFPLANRLYGETRAFLREANLVLESR